MPDLNIRMDATPHRLADLSHPMDVPTQRVDASYEPMDARPWGMDVPHNQVASPNHRAVALKKTVKGLSEFTIFRICQMFPVIKQES